MIIIRRGGWGGGKGGGERAVISHLGVDHLNTKKYGKRRLYLNLGLPGRFKFSVICDYSNFDYSRIIKIPLFTIRFNIRLFANIMFFESRIFF